MLTFQKSLATLLFVFPIFLFGQIQNPKPAFWKTKFDLPVILAGGTFFALGEIHSKKVVPLTLAEVNYLTAHPPSHLDFAERNYSKTARSWSDGLVYASYATAATVCLTQQNSRKQLLGNALQLAEVGLVTTGATLFTKTRALHLRPYIYNDAAPLEKKLKTDARYSFFSGHTSSAAACSFYSASIWAQNHADSKYKKAVWTGAIAYPAVVGFLRMKGGMHHFEDVAVGYAVGALIGWGVPKLHRMIF
jgi:membrane-associated phospholipid phosphatase